MAAAARRARREGRAAATASTGSFASAAVSLEAAVAEALAEARISRSLMTDEGGLHDPGMHDPEAAKAAFSKVVSLVRTSLSSAPSLRRAFNAVANLAIAPDHVESAISDVTGEVESRPVPYFALVHQANAGKDASEQRLAELRRELDLAIVARSSAER